MRSTKLRAGLAAAATLLAVAPSGALAARIHIKKDRHLSPTGCRIDLSVAPHLLTAGEPALAYGHLTCATPTSAASQTVTLYEHAVGTPGFTSVATTTTNTEGFYSVSTGPAQYNAQFYSAADEAVSRRQAVRVSAQVTLVGPTETKQLLTGHSHQVTFTGTVNPADVGAIVVLQRQNAIVGENWNRIQVERVKAGGVFSLTHTFAVPGDANLRVLVHSNRRNIPSASNVLNYQVSQTENAKLTIESSADPIPYGSSVTISGKVAGGKETLVTLLSRNVRQRGFGTVAQVKTDASGNYTFPAQSPVSNTLYRVKDATESSAVLYQGVRDVLTAEASPTTIAAGQTVTFSGAVSPDRSGHVIYLERQNASGTSFHVVDVAVVSAGSKYTIPYTVYSPAGTDVFRVQIPGDAQNGGASSQLFTITVTPPSAASTLTPEPPSNTKHPQEGTV
jgi:hypothetical protein